MWHTNAFQAEMNGDIMYLHQALRQDDAADFVPAAVKEVNNQVILNNWQLIKCSEDLKMPLWSPWCGQFSEDMISTYHHNNVQGLLMKQMFRVNY